MKATTPTLQQRIRQWLSPKANHFPKPYLSDEFSYEVISYEKNQDNGTWIFIVDITSLKLLAATPDGERPLKIRASLIRSYVSFDIAGTCYKLYNIELKSRFTQISLSNFTTLLLADYEDQRAAYLYFASQRHFFN